MQALIDYLQTAPIPRNERPNVNELPIRSITVGLVNQRQNGYGISTATTFDKLRLLRSLVNLVNDPAIAGNAPDCYTSICLNVDFASNLHTDSYNYGGSFIVALGDFTGGELFVEKDADESREERCSIEHANSQVKGVSVDVKGAFV